MSLPEARKGDAGLTRTVVQGSDIASVDVPSQDTKDVTAVVVITTAGPFPPTADPQTKLPPWMYTIPAFDDDEVFEQFKRNIRANRERSGDDEEVLP